MKYFALLTFLILVSYLLGFIKKPEKYQWMDRNYTTAIKGLSILTVVWAHSGARLSVGGIQFIAGIGVALFLMCSGYGLEISYEKNGLKGFWRKRLLGVCLPFWVVELVGMLATGTFSVKTYLLDFCFLRPATGYGWFMGYIVICYLIFYAVKKLVKDGRMQMTALFGAFAIWFVLDSVFFANPNMPFLRARQMLSFPVGVLLAVNKDKIERTLTKTKNILILTGGGTVCLLFMAITQLNVVKNLPYLVSNAMALLTCLPMAIGTMVFGKSFGGLFENKMLAVTGMISYEIYLVHAFTLGMIKPSAVSVIAFVVVTVTLSYATYFTIGKMKNVKFNNYYPHKK
ncbi:acyltransferase family protein [Enterococcus cecorum]|uniref:acyltransferase family protein n=1 Tax=Enterococcus cecorum TaxID=44008 RepID=UPI0032C3F6AE